MKWFKRPVHNQVMRIFAKAPLLGLFLCCLSAVSLAEQVSEQPAATHWQHLASDPEWLRLLRYENGESTVVDDDFFVSRQGRNNALAELQAVVEAADMPSSGIADSHPRCRFPARYWWLSRQLNRPDWKEIPAFCQKLRRWPVLLQAKSVSVVYVAGYLGNPASVFGHAFLKINTGREDTLLDQTINYGALIPPKESTVMYVYRGLTGGYLAGFSDRYYFTQDMTYSNTEFRDMWDYELMLAPQQLRFLLYHLWELIGKKQQYFFLTRNCAYELGRVLNVVFAEEIVDKPRVWFAPVELFESLKILNDKRAKRRQAVIGQIAFKPSWERKLYESYRVMPPKLKKIAIRLVGLPTEQWDSLLASLAPNEQLVVLDFAVAVSYFRYMKDFPDVAQAVKRRHQQVIVKRLQYPRSQPVRAAQAQTPPPPTEQAPPRYLGVGLDNDGAAEVSFSPFSQNSTGLNDLEGNALVVAEARLNSDNGKLQSMDFIRIRKLARRDLPLDDFDSWSWRVRLGTERQSGVNESSLKLFGAFSLGKSYRLWGQTWSLMADVTASEGGAVALAPRVEVFGGLNSRLKFLVEGTYAAGWNDTRQWQLEASWQYHPERQWSIYGYYKKQDEQVGIALRYHW